MIGKNIKKHESYGMIQISRVQGGDSALFGSSIKHDNKIEIRIHPAEVDRHLNTDWFHAINLPYIEIELSPTQFAEAITNMNTQGVPCTIKRLNGKGLEKCPFENKRQLIDDEFKETISDISRKLDNLTKRTEELLTQNKAPKKSEKEEILNAISNLKMEIKSNIPYIKEQFTEQMDKTTTEAKGEVEAYWLHKINQLGLGGLEKEKIKLLGE